MEGNVIGFRIEGHTPKGVLSIKKNARIPFLMRTLIGSEVVSEKPLIVEVKLKPKLFKKSRKDSVKKLVISSAENLSAAIDVEMIKSGCVDGLDYSLEVLRE